MDESISHTGIVVPDIGKMITTAVVSLAHCHAVSVRTVKYAETHVTYRRQSRGSKTHRSNHSSVSAPISQQ